MTQADNPQPNRAQRRHPKRGEPLLLRPPQLQAQRKAVRPRQTAAQQTASPETPNSPSLPIGGSVVPPGNETGDMAADESAPPTDSIVPTEKKRTRGRPRAGTTDKELIDGLAALYGTVGAAWMLVNQYDGTIVLMTAQQMAEADLAACKPYPEAYRILKLIARGNVWTVLAMAHLGPTCAILSNHGVLRRGVASAFHLPEPPEREESEPAPNPVVDSGAYTTEQMAAAIAEQQAQMAAQAAGLEQGTAGGIGGPIGDAGEVAARRAFTVEQINTIREQAIAQAIAQQQAALAHPEMAPPAVYNPAGVFNG